MYLQEAKLNKDHLRHTKSWKGEWKQTLTDYNRVWMFQSDRVCRQASMAELFKCKLLSLLSQFAFKEKGG